MNRICILDCTLRDGGYINDFSFGSYAIRSIIQKLTQAGIDIIECGFLQSGCTDSDKSLFASVEQIKKYLPLKKTASMYVAMIQYGKISNEEISVCDGKSITGIRLTFHEHEMDDAFTLGQQLMDKGYKVFMQPVGTTTYTDDALLKLIGRINELRPFAFYMVDTLGTLYKSDLLRMFYLIDHNLKKNIVLGFHSHNNLQLSFANAQELLQINCNRSIVIDTSVYGMGRGAGNLCTELVTQYINENFVIRYNNISVLEIIDQFIKPLTLKFSWGYDIAYYISSTIRCHPNYATFLLGLQSLHVQDIFAILSMINSSKRALFDKEYIRELYLSYMSKTVEDTDTLSEIQKKIAGREVVLIAPGKTIETEHDKIVAYIEKNNCCVISINFIPQIFTVDMMFISNMKRFTDSEEIKKEKIYTIATSNIDVNPEENIGIVNYGSFLNPDSRIVDNAGLMCINLLRKLECTKIRLAGFDGFNRNLTENYIQDNMMAPLELDRIVELNETISERLREIKTQIDLDFITHTWYDI